MADISNSRSNTVIIGTSDNDTINNRGDSVTIDSGNGDDYICNYDSWSSSGINVLAYGDNGDDTLINGYHNTFYGSKGNGASLIGGEGTDSICNEGGDSVSIDGGKGNDFIRNRGKLVTITGGAGNDFIENRGNGRFEDGAVLRDGSDEQCDSVSVSGGTGNDTITHYLGKDVTISGGTGNDSIVNYSGEYTSINGDDGDDTIYSFLSDNVTLNGGAGNDCIIAYGIGLPNSVWDSRIRYGQKATLNGGAGNDTLTGGYWEDVFVYETGDDVVTNYSHEDVIHIASGNLDSYSFDGGDLIFHIGSGSVRLKNMTNHAITVKDSSGNTTTQVYGTGYSGQDVIKNLVKAWNKTLLSNKSIEKLDEAIKLCSHFNNIQEVIDQMIDDCRAAGDADTFLRDYCGIILDNEDTGAITGWDAGGLSIKTAHDIVGETLSSLQHVPDYEDATFKTSQGVTINISSTGDSLTADGKKVFDALYSWWADEALNLIEESYGVDFKDSNEINFALTPSADYWGHTSNGKEVTINMNSTRFNGDDDYNGNGVDRCIVHEFTHVAQNLFMGRFPKFLQEGFADLTCGIDDKNGKSSYMRSLAGDADRLASYLDLNNYNTGNSYYYAAGFMFYRYLAKQVSDSYDSLKSYAWKDGSSIVGTSAAEFLTGNGKNQTISAGKENDTITVYGEKIKVFGEDGNDYILVSSLASGASINSGSGNDTVENHGNKISISSGVGNDTIKNYGFNVTIDGGTNDDYIKSTGNNVKIMGGNGNDTLLVEKTSNYNWDKAVWEDTYHNKATIDGGAGNEFIKNENSNASINAGNDNDTVENHGDNVTIDGGTNNDYIKSYGDNVKVIGGDGNDTLLVEKTSNYNWDKAVWEDTYHNKATIDGGAGNEFIKNENSNASINAGNDNDTVENHGDNVTINGGAGKDSITNYAEGSKSVIDGGAGNDVINNWAGEIWNEKTQTYDLTPSPDNTTLLGGAGNDSILNEGSNVSIYGGDDNDILINGQYFETERGGQNVTLSAGNGNDTIISHGSKSFLEGGAGDDSIINGYRYYAPWNAFYDSDSDAYNGNNSTISSGVGNDTIKNCGKNVCFEYASGDGNDLIEGFNTTSTLNISGTYSSTKGGSDVVVTVGNGKITLQGAASLSKVNIVSAEKNSWKINGNTATYGNLITISGVASVATDSNFYISGKTLTIGKTAVQTNGTPVKLLKGDYTLKLGKGMIESTNVATAYDAKTMTYTTAGKTEGYSLSSDKKSISYNAATSKEFKFSGIANGATDANFYIKGNTVTIGKAAVQTNGTPVKLLNQSGYTLKLGKGMTEPTNVATVYDAKTMTYTTAGKSDGYSLSSDKKSISYNAATSKEFKFSGIANGATASNFYISGNTVTIGKAAVQTNGTPVKLLNQSGYTLKLGKGMEAPTNNTGTLKNGIYTFGGKSTGYILDTKNNTIKYSAATSATLELSGVKSAPTAPTDDTLTLNLANFDKNLSVTSNTGKYKFSIASGTYTGKTFTGSNSNDTISNAGANLIINSGNGNDSVISSGANIKIDSGNGNDYIKSTGTSSTIFGGAGNDTMAGSSGADTLSGDAGNDILWGGKGNDSMKGGTGNDSLVGYDGDDRISGDAGNDTILGGNGNDFLYGGTDNDYLEGNASSDTLSGAAGNDTLWGGADNDTLTGGAGNDVFIYKPDEGTDHITDYASGDILQILRTDGTNGTYTKATFASNKLTLTINGGGSIIFDNVSAGDKININGTTRTIAGNTLK